MDMDSAAAFLAASILIGTGIVFIGIVIVVLNNIFHKYWKPVQWSLIPEVMREHSHSRFATHDELTRVAPHLETETKEKK